MSVIGGLVRLRRDHACYEDLSVADDGDAGIPCASSAVAGNRLTAGPTRQPKTPSTPGSYVSFSEDTYTVEQAIDAMGFGKFQLKLSFFTGLVWVVFAGMMLSSGLWGKICDKYGRKMEMITCSAFTFYFGLLSAFSPNYFWILLLRSLVGFGIGGVPQSVTLYAEFLPSKARAKCVVLIEVFWAVGASFIVFVSIFIMPRLGWRALLLVAALPLLLFFIACFWLPESIRYDVARGESGKALSTLKRIADDNGKPMPLGRLIEVAPSRSLDGPVKRGRLRDLFVPDLRMTTILLWFIWFSSAFSYFGIVLMTTELFEVGDSCHGGDVEQHRKPACSLACKLLSTKDYTDFLWTTLAEFPGLVITFLTIEWLGRRWTMALEMLVFAFFVFLVNMCTTRPVLTLFLFIARAFISGAFQAAYVYTPEVYPTTTRALGLGTCSGVARVGAIITPFIAQVLLRESTHLALCTYGAVSLLAAIAAVMLPIETKGREMRETHVQSSGK